MFLGEYADLQLDRLAYICIPEDALISKLEV